MDINTKASIKEEASSLPLLSLSLERLERLDGTCLRAETSSLTLAFLSVTVTVRWCWGQSPITGASAGSPITVPQPDGVSGTCLAHGTRHEGGSVLEVGGWASDSEGGTRVNPLVAVGLTLLCTQCPFHTRTPFN